MKLWGDFFEKDVMSKIPAPKENSPMFGVYSSYESDFNGDYTVTAGLEVSTSSKSYDLDAVKIEAGKYLFFKGKGEMPSIVFETWKKIWTYRPDEHSNELLHIAKEKLYFTFRGVNLNDIPDKGFRNNLSKMQNTNSYFEFRSIEHELRRLDYCLKIKQLAPMLPLNYYYLKKLCNRLDLPVPDKAKPESIAFLIEAVPMVTNWDMKFNASVSSKSLIDGLPCINIYELLLIACDSFLHTVVPLAIFNEELTENQENRRKEQSTDFMESLHSCINLLLGESNKFNANVSKNSKTFRTIHTMVEASVQAVWLHEFGHLLQGHIGLSPSYQIEFEADSFAYKILSNETKDQTIDIWFALEGLAPLIIIDIIQTVKKSSPSKTHPSGKDRILGSSGKCVLFPDT